MAAEASCVNFSHSSIADAVGSRLRSPGARSPRTSPSEGMKELLVGWSSAVRCLRQPLRRFLRTRTFLNAMKRFPPGCNPGERPQDKMTTFLNAMP